MIHEGVKGLRVNGDEEAVKDDEEDDEEDDDEDEEPYMATPERNRLLRGLAKSQWAEKELEGYGRAGVSGGMDESVKVECEVCEGPFFFFFFSF